MRALALGLMFLLAAPLHGAFAQDEDSAAEEGESTQIGRYQVSDVSGTFLLLDTATGKSWLLSRTDNEQVPAVWVPIPQFEKPQDAPELTRNPLRTKPPATLSAYQSMIAELKLKAAELGVEQKRLGQNLGVDHPSRKQIQEQLAAVEAQIDEETQKMLTSIDEQITALRLKLEDLQVKYGPEHPEVKELKRQIDHWKEYLVVLEIEY